jgi:hypothetical protein
MSWEESKIQFSKTDVSEECIKNEEWGSLPQMNKKTEEK